MESACCFPNLGCGILVLVNQMKQKRDLQQGTLALTVLKSLDVLGPLHGYGLRGALSRSAAMCFR